MMEKKVQHHSFASEYPFAQAPFVEKAILSSIEVLELLKINCQQNILLI